MPRNTRIYSNLKWWGGNTAKSTLATWEVLTAHTTSLTAKSWNRDGLICFNFANTSQTYNYDYAILKEFGENMETDSVLFVPVSYFSFNNEVVNAKEAEAMSIRYYHFLSPNNIPGV